MRIREPFVHAGAVALAVFAAVAVHAPSVARAEDAPAPLEIFATVPDLASLARAVGGEAVNVTTMVSPGEDPHFAEARPSFVKALSRADILLSVGAGMEAGYLGALVANARNASVLPGKPGNTVAADAVVLLGTPTGVVSRAMGDVHAAGNPHFLVDPLRGLDVANLIRERLTLLRPSDAALFARRYEQLRRRVGIALVGEPLDAKYDGTKLARLYAHGKLLSFLDGQGDARLLGGWLGRLAPYRDSPAVDDHDMWPYLAERFAVRILGHLEPLPGIQPTTGHLKKIVELMKANDVNVVIASRYYDPRHARFIAETTGAHVATLAHQTGATGDGLDYVDTIDFNVRALADAFGAGKK